MGIINLREKGKAASDLFSRALVLYEHLGDVYGQATSHNLIANGHFAASEINQAEAHYRQALEMFTQSGNFYNQVLVSNNLGGIAMKRGQYESRAGLLPTGNAIVGADRRFFVGAGSVGTKPGSCILALKDSLTMLSGTCRHPKHILSAPRCVTCCPSCMAS